MRACIDIGGTKVAVSLAPDALSAGAPPPLQARRTEPTAKTGDNGALARQVLRLVDEVCGEAGVAPTAISTAGVSSCGPFILNNGLIELAGPTVNGTAVLGYTTTPRNGRMGSTSGNFCPSFFSPFSGAGEASSFF